MYHDFGPNIVDKDYSDLINWYPFDWDKSGGAEFIKQNESQQSNRDKAIPRIINIDKKQQTR